MAPSCTARSSCAKAGSAAAALGAGPALAQQTIKIGIILPYTGQFADGATQMDNAIKLYVKQNGETVAGRKLEFVRKDTGGIAPDVAKRLATSAEDMAATLGTLKTAPARIARK